MEYYTGEGYFVIEDDDNEEAYIESDRVVDLPCR